MHLFSVISANIATSHMLLKQDSLGYFSTADNLGLFSVSLTKLTLIAKLPEYGEGVRELHRLCTSAIDSR